MSNVEKRFLPTHVKIFWIQGLGTYGEISKNIFSRQISQELCLCCALQMKEKKCIYISPCLSTLESLKRFEENRESHEHLINIPTQLAFTNCFQCVSVILVATGKVRPQMSLTIMVSVVMAVWFIADNLQKQKNLRSNPNKTKQQLVRIKLCDNQYLQILGVAIASSSAILVISPLR